MLQSTTLPLGQNMIHNHWVPGQKDILGICINQNLELVNINAYIRNLVNSKDIERKRNTDINQLCYKFAKNDR